MILILKIIPTGMFGSNTYIIGDSREGVIIDAGVSADEIMNAVKEFNLEIKFIILTHGHIDHICCADEYRTKLGAPVFIHECDSEYLTDPEKNASSLIWKSLSFNSADKLLKDGDVLKAGSLDFTVLHTPGHTPGCICIKVGNILFSGDTLFKDSVGRTDLAGGSYESLVRSINEKLMPLGEDVIVYPGHGPSTTIGYEKKNNHYI